jgi:hypothetical protein
MPMEPTSSKSAGDEHAAAGEPMRPFSTGRNNSGQFPMCSHGYAGSRRFTSRSTLSLSLPRIGQAAIRRTPTFFTKPR